MPRAILVVFLVAVLAACGRPAAPFFDPPEWNFGSIPSYHVARKQVEILNPGSKPVQLRFISTCDCLCVDRAPGELAGGAAAIVELSYDPAERSGFEEAAVIVVAGKGRRESRAALRVYGKVLPSGAGGDRPAP